MPFDDMRRQGPERGGAHERTIREFQLSQKGIRVGEPLTEFHGVLTGIPIFHGTAGGMMQAVDGKT